MHLDDPGAGDVAAILGDALGVVRATHRWRALHAPLGVVTDLASAVFTHPSAAWFYLDLAQVQVAVVAQLRARATSGGPDAPGTPGASGTPGARGDGPVPPSAVGLAARSERFRALWSGLAVAHRPRTPYEVRHPALGVLRLDRVTVRQPDGTWCERLVPRPGDRGDRDAESLALLDLL
ncbi:hypothetical protein [Cellulomonas hominis]|uniref:MmyB family transcriptional regulator n=1 Tax=Cellulomonas hominis TaxID=156981 RepID=UPI001BA38A88|nr:hypothetical protein [Cellulomonas hominis]VTR76109.1 hypothetical protein CHMI_00865 [Cellulomonas hominis]